MMTKHPHCASKPPRPLQPSLRLAEAGLIEREPRQDVYVDDPFCGDHGGPNLVLLVMKIYFEAATA